MQQETSVIQSFDMASMGAESAKQGRALMLFTIVTVILSVQWYQIASKERC